MEKGTRVRVTGGRNAKGLTGTVFWTGPDNYSEGLRCGVRGDDGETHWLNAEHLEKLEAEEDPGPAEPPDVGKGARVSFSAGGETIEGDVFWIGENKLGPGTRLGVRDGDGETHWLDAVRVTVIEPAGGSAEAAPSDQPPPPGPSDQPPPPGPEDEPPPAESRGAAAGLRVTWTCPSCGRREAVPPKWCGCEPYPISAEELMGVATYELWLDGGERRRIDEPAFERLVADHRLELSRGEPVAPAIVKTVTAAGIEVACTEDVYWAPLPPKVS